jgi:hypothetical protein
MNTIAVTDSENNSYEIYTNYCKTWSPIKQGEINLNIKPKNMKHLLEWYDHVSKMLTENSTYGKAGVNINGAIVNKEINPFNDDNFDMSTDIDIDDVEDLSQLSRWRLKEYVREYFTDEWTMNWIGDIAKSKTAFFDFLYDCQYLKCEVVRGICAVYMADIMSKAMRNGCDDKFVENLNTESSVVWINDINTCEDSDSEDDSDNDIEDNDGYSSSSLNSKEEGIRNWRKNIKNFINSINPTDIQR